MCFTWELKQRCTRPRLWGKSSTSWCVFNINSLQGCAKRTFCDDAAFYLVFTFIKGTYMCTHVKTQGVVQGLHEKQKSPPSVSPTSHFLKANPLNFSKELSCIYTHISKSHTFTATSWIFTFKYLLIPMMEEKNLALFLTPSHHPYSHDPSPSQLVFPNSFTWF